MSGASPPIPSSPRPCGRASASPMPPLRMFRRKPGPECWLRNRRPEDWRAKAEMTPQVFADDIALLDASESVRQTAKRGAERAETSNP